jgi:hypothetical protein
MIFYIIFLYDFLVVYFYSMVGKLIKNTHKNNNVFISLTTIPSRSKNIIFSLNSILNQTIIPQKIFITISKKNLREQQIDYQIPEIIKKYPLIEIIIIDKDNGPINKLYGGISKCEYNDDIIITVDDDSIYNRYMIENIYKYSQKYKNQVIGTIGRIDYNTKIFGYYTRKPIEVKLLEGYGAIGYRKKFLSLQDINTDNLSKEIIFNDDIYISYLLKKKNIKSIMIPSNIKEPITYTIFTEKTNPLWKQNENNGLFKKCLQTLKLD